MIIEAFDVLFVKPGGIELTQMRVKKVFKNNENKKVMEINILPSKYCNFNCVFCPLGPNGTQTDESFSFDSTEEFLSSLAAQIDAEKPDILFFNSMGESFANGELEKFISLAREKDVKISLYGNGYLLGYPEYARIASLCDEVTGEVKAITEEGFQKLQRPMKGSTLEQYWNNMLRFREGYKGKFMIALSIIKDVNDDTESIEYIRTFLNELKADKVMLETFDDEKFGKAFGVSQEKMENVKRQLQESPNHFSVEFS
jgi:wyosine [tRNA(Phe)-imidazoG37] synthetase (radical SAM superfamily)